jgi:hypothetical protein
MFIICSLFAVAGIVGFFGKLLAGGEFVSLALGIPAAFGLKDAAINYIHKDKPNPDDP